MIYFISVLFAASIATVTILVAQQLTPARPAVVSRRLQELAEMGTNPFDIARRRERLSRRQRLEKILEMLGSRTERKQVSSATRAMLIHAGLRGPRAPVIYQGARIAIPLGIFGISLLLTPFMGPKAMMFGGFAALMGWVAPAFYVGSRVRKRQKELQKALPDALDAMVVCVEAGLGLNQAMVRVSDEIRHISTLMSDELTLTNLEIRAGTPREDALRSLADRTGLPDLRSLVTMLIQTDRFGTSIAQALRVQSDTLRERRKQRAEEAAAKTSIKMLFPLIFFIFPAMFVITLGPAVIKLIENWGTGPI
jgi:tight adherence protein C